MEIFFNFPLTSSHLYPLQVENCDSNLRLVVGEDDYGEFKLERVIKALIYLYKPWGTNVSVSSFRFIWVPM